MPLFIVARPYRLILQARNQIINMVCQTMKCFISTENTHPITDNMKTSVFIGEIEK